MENSSTPANNVAINTMQADTQAPAPESNPKVRRRPAKKEVIYPPLNEQPLEHLTTNEAAFYLRLRPQTLRKQLCKGKCKIRPIKINGRLLWRKTAIVDLLRTA